MLAPMKNAQDVYLEDVEPVLIGRLQQRLHTSDHPGTVAADMKTAKSAHRMGHHGTHVLIRGDITASYVNCSAGLVMKIRQSTLIEIYT
jgi:hypothetical protein